MSDILEFQKIYINLWLFLVFLCTIKFIVQNICLNNRRGENRKLREENDRLHKIIQMNKIKLYEKNETPIRSGYGARSHKTK